MAIRIQLRRGTAAQWTASNPILADGELGLEKDTRFYKIGDGVLSWNNLTYASLRNIDQTTMLEMTQQELPAAPAAGKMFFFTKSLAGRMLPRISGPSGVSTPLQPSLFQNNIVLILPNTTTSISTFGQPIASAGTLSHPVPGEQYGYMTNFNIAIAVGTAGTGLAVASLFRGSVPGSNGFFFNTRLALTDASYDESGAGTGSRIFVGLTSGTMVLSAGSDAPGGSTAGFQRCHVNGARLDANWQFITRDSVSNQTTIDTGLPFRAEKVYDFILFCVPQGDVVSWKIVNVTDDTSAEGSTSDTLPVANLGLRAGFQIQTVNAIPRNIRMQRVYIESDR